jgi:hypothetical protein
LPYRNPGDEARLWKRKQGRVTLEIQAAVFSIKQRKISLMSVYRGNQAALDLGAPEHQSITEAVISDRG